MKAHLDAPLGIWEVQSIEPGVGSLLTDLLSGEERFVYDASSTATLEPWLGLLAYVVDCDGISFFGGLHLQPLPPTETNALVKEIRRLTRVRTKPVSLEFRTDPGQVLSREIRADGRANVRRTDRRPAALWDGPWHGHTATLSVGRSETWPSAIATRMPRT